MSAAVFISHSCKDSETAPPANLTAQQAAERAERLKFARAVRDQLFAALKKKKGLKVFLDVRGGLNAGDVWRNGLHTALRTCSAGVVLLTPESLESGWVLKEATILSWRVFVGEPVMLVPIVLGVTPEDLEQRGFGALNLDAIQWLAVKSTDAAEIKRVTKQAAEIIAAKIPKPLSQARPLQAPEAWIQEFAVCLGKAIGTTTPDLNNQYLVGMCRELGIAPADADRFDGDPLINLASQALFADEDQIVRFLRHAGAPPEPQRAELQQAVAALWVDPTPASRLLTEKANVIVIDAAETASAREYVARAFCNKVPWDRVIQPSDVTGGSDAEVVDEIRKSLEEVLPIDDAAALESDIRKNGRAYVIVGPGSSRPSVLDAVTTAWPPLTFIAAAGPKPQEKLGNWWSKGLRLYPLLQPSREQAAFRFRNRLAKFVKGIAQ